MKIKDKLTRAEQKYILWKSQKLRRDFADDELGLSTAVNFLILGVILEPDKEEQVEVEMTPFGQIKYVKREECEKYLDSIGIDDITKEIDFFNRLIDEADCLFFLRKAASEGLDTMSGAK